MTLNDVQTGDKVVYNSGSKFQVRVVERRTPKRIQIMGRTFNVSDGFPVEKQGYGQIHPATEQMVGMAEEWEKERAQRQNQLAHDEQMAKERYKEKCLEISQLIREAATGAEGARILADKVWELT